MNWKQALLFSCLVIWMGTLLLGHNLENSAINKTPKPYRQNSLGRPIEEDHEVIEQEPKLEPSSRIQTENTHGLKRILFFTPYFHMTDWQFGFGHEPFITNHCPETNCYATNNRTMFGKKICHSLSKMHTE